MKRPVLRLATLALALGALLAAHAPAQGVGSKLPEVELEGYSATKARSFADFAGRAVMLEFFSHT
jgi:hypothetical protein